MENAVFDCIYSRKSVRSFTDEPVSRDTIEKLIDAGTHAANGVNAQALRFAVVTDRNKLRRYSDSGKRLFLEAMRENGRPDEHLEMMLSNQNFDIFYNAPAVIFIFSEPSAATPVEDASLASANIMLGANSLGLGTCWIGFASQLAEDPEFVKENKVKGGLKLRSSIIVGHPKNKAPPTPRNPPVIISWS